MGLSDDLHSSPPPPTSSSSSSHPSSSSAWPPPRDEFGGPAHPSHPSGAATPSSRPHPPRGQSHRTQFLGLDTHAATAALASASSASSSPASAVHAGRVLHSSFSSSRSAAAPQLQQRSRLYDSSDATRNTAAAALPLFDAHASPKDRLNALLAAAPVSTTAAAQPRQNPPKPAWPSREASLSSLPGAPLPPPPPPPPQPQPATAAAEPAHMPPPLAAADSAMRNSSLDSAMSSVSSASASNTPSQPSSHTAHSQQSSTETATQPVADPATLITTAGSAEAAIVKLQSELKSTGNRNEQLWRLVEKQRAMILRLNKDLENALKDKDRYRHKYKELSASSPSHAAHDSVTSTAAGDTRAHHGYGASVGSVGTFIDAAAEVSDGSRGRSDSKLADVIEEEATPRSATHPLSSPTSTPQVKSPKTPTMPLTQPASVSSPEKTRKAAPAPLNLAQTQTKNPIQARRGDEEALDDASDSDFEGPRPADFDRGRRRTRTEDDDYREAVAREEEWRSRSGKSKSKSKSKSSAPEAGPTTTTGPAAVAVPPHAAAPPPPAVSDPGNHAAAGLSGLPSSPRGALLGGLQSPLQPGGIASLASAMQSSNLVMPPHIPPPPAQPAQAKAHTVHLPPKSPGLPMSPRPGDRPMNAPTPRAPNKGLISPGPLSPRSGLPLSPRAPRQPIPLPQQDHTLAIHSPHLARAAAYSESMAQPASMAEMLSKQQSSDSPYLDADEPTPTGHVFRGFVSDQYPNLLIPPNALPLVDIRVYSSRLRPPRSNPSAKVAEEDQVFTLAVHGRSDSRQLWRLEKTSTAFAALEQVLRASNALKTKSLDKSLFSGHAPAKIDARRAALNEYFQVLLDTPLDEKSARIVCAFFSADVIGPTAESHQSTGSSDVDSGVGITPASRAKQHKEGYLAKKGKQFGGWKARYFVLEDQQLHYFESPNHNQLGTIRLANAQIARQNTSESDDDAEFRHAFMVLEPKRKDSNSLVRHVLCAEKDSERDEWVEAILSHINALPPASSTKPASGPNKLVRKASLKTKTAEEPTMELQGFDYESTVPAEAPKIGSFGRPSDSPGSDVMAPPGSATQPHQLISGPVSGGPIHNSAAWGNKTPAQVTSKEQKKRSMFGFMSRSSEDNSSPHSKGLQKDRRGPIRPVFGMPLAEAAEFFPPAAIDICLPAPIYRCIEFMEAKDAHTEEGIFRINGSNTVVRGLKERFNAEGDVNLLDGSFNDLHGAASLLKLYLRELPETILTKELHLDFLKLLEIEDRTKRLGAINVLVHRLPEANYELLATLARFLIDIVNHSEINMMNSRNIGIVFSPTLNIPAPLISIFLSDYDSIFTENDPDSASAASPILDELAMAPQSAADDIRSPRKQMFTDLPTPGYNQLGFAPLQASNANGLRQPQDLRMMYDTGFAPVQSTYDAPRAAVTQVHPDAYSSLNAALVPALAPSQASLANSPADSTLLDSADGSPADTRAPATVLKMGPPEASMNRQAKRESSLLGPSNGTAGHQNTLEARRKSSYQRLREMAGMKE